MKFVFIFFLSFYFGFLFSQKNCSGVLIDSTTNNPIEFANIGLIGKGIGSVTNSNGEFSFFIPDSLATSPVKVSMIGYKAKTFLVKATEEKLKIIMAQSANNLNEVIVSSKKTKTKILGNQTKTQTVRAGFLNNTLGAELAVKLKIKNPKTHLLKFYLNIATNDIEKPIFRFNLYNINEKGLPNENILKQNIIIEFKEQRGLIELDLTPYNLLVDEDVFISVEWIKDLGDVKGLYFSTKLSGPTYYRLASQDKWKKSPVGVGLYAEVAY